MAKKINLSSFNDRALINHFNEKLAKYKNEKRGVDDLKHKLSTQMPTVQAGGMDDVNKIIWPFYFSTPFVELPPTSSISRYISVTQEAAFVWTYTVKTVFEKVEVAPGVFEWNYIDPNDYSDGIAENLEFTISDAQSSRTFHFNPISINHVGHAQEPEKLDTPMMIAANNNLEVKYYNNDPARTYVPFFTFYGYRVRVKDSQEILGFVNR